MPKIVTDEERACRLSFSYPRSLKETLIHMADEEGRSLSSLIKHILLEGIRKRIRMDEYNGKRTIKLTKPQGKKNETNE